MGGMSRSHIPQRFMSGTKEEVKRDGHTGHARLNDGGLDWTGREMTPLVNQRRSTGGARTLAASRYCRFQFPQTLSFKLSASVV